MSEELAAAAEPTTTTESFEPAELNIADASESIGRDLFPKSEAAEEPEPAKDPTPVEPEKPTESETPATPVNPPPKTWRADALAEWDKLTPTVQAEVLKREEDMFKGLEGYKADAEVGKSLKTVLQPYDHIFKGTGANPLAMINGLMNAHVTLSSGTPEQKAGMLQNLINHYGVNLDPSNAPYSDPVTNELQNKINQLESKLSAFEGSQQEKVMQTHKQTVDAFVSDPKNIYFDEVATDIADLIRSGVAKNLPDAYEKAVWANPTTRAKESARLQTETSELARKEAEKKSEEAKAAAAANLKTKQKVSSSTAASGTMEETMHETLARIKNRNK